jgi:hypothetical protein
MPAYFVLNIRICWVRGYKGVDGVKLGFVIMMIQGKRLFYLSSVLMIRSQIQ